MTHVTFPPVSSVAWCTSMVRCTIGIGLSGNQQIGIWPTQTISVLFQRRITSPRWKAGAIDSESITIIGCDVFDITDKSFYSIYGVDKRHKHTNRSAQKLLVDQVIVGKYSSSRSSEYGPASEGRLYCFYGTEFPLT
jgi:hypothetical protein